MVDEGEDVKRADRRTLERMLNDQANWRGSRSEPVPREVLDALDHGRAWDGSLKQVEEFSWTPRWVGERLMNPVEADYRPVDGRYWIGEASIEYEWALDNFATNVPALEDAEPQDEQVPVSDREVRAILDELDDLLVDFPFETEADRANTLALLLTPFVAFDGPPPMAVVTAPAPGHGKTTLAEVVLAIGYPKVKRIPDLALDTRRRFLKQLTSALVEAPAAVFIDNLSVDLDSSTLASVLTSGRHAFPEGDDLREVPMNALTVVTRNDGKVSRELQDRSLAIGLDAEMEYPDSRSFAIPQIVRHARERRYHYTHRLLRLVQRWVEDGAPDGSRRHGRARDWSRKVGGVLESIGVDGFLGNRGRLAEGRAPGGNASAADLLAAAHDRYGDRLVPTSELAEDLARGGPLAEARPGELDTDPSAQKVGTWLGNHADQRYGDHHVTKTRTSSARGWRFTRVES